MPRHIQVIEKATLSQAAEGVSDDLFITPKGVKVAINALGSDHLHTTSQITDFPQSLPANGGNADSVNNRSVDDTRLDTSTLWTSFKVATEIGKYRDMVFASELMHEVVVIEILEEDLSEMPIPIKNYVESVHRFEMRIGGLTIPKTRYKITGDKVSLLDGEVFPIGRKIDFSFLYLEQVRDNSLPVDGINLKDGSVTEEKLSPEVVKKLNEGGGGVVTRSLSPVELRQEVIEVEVTEETTREVVIPIENYSPSIHVFELRIGGLPIPKRRFSISNGKVILNQEEKPFQVGRLLTFDFLYLEQVRDNSNPVDGVNLKNGTVTPEKLSQELLDRIDSIPNIPNQRMGGITLRQVLKSVTATTENQKTFSIPIDNYNPNVHNVEVRIGTTPLHPSRFTLQGGTLTLNDNETGVAIGRRLDFIVSYLEQVEENGLPVDGKNIKPDSILENKLSSEVTNKINAKADKVYVDEKNVEVIDKLVNNGIFDMAKVVFGDANNLGHGVFMGENLLNAPVPTLWFYYKVIVSTNGDFGEQEAIDYLSGQRYRRNKYQGSWQPWVNIVTSDQVSNHNHLINGSFDVWQDTTGQVLAQGESKYITDMWIAYNTYGCTSSVDFRKANNHNVNCILMDTASPTGQIVLAQNLEPHDIEQIRDKDITISFDIWSSAETGETPISIVARRSNTTENLGFGAMGYELDLSHSFIVSPKYTRYSFTTKIPTDTKSLSIGLIIQNGSQKRKIAFSNAKLETSTYPTKFVPRPYVEELTRCKRFFGGYETSGSTLVVNDGTQFQIPLIDSGAPMRVTPTFITSSGIYLHQTGAGGDTVVVNNEGNYLTRPAIERKGGGYIIEPVIGASMTPMPEGSIWSVNASPSSKNKVSYGIKYFLDARIY